MIVGNGLLATYLRDYFKINKVNDDNYLIFASGVSNSSENKETEFEREIYLLQQIIHQNIGTTIVYFSSCALVDDTNLTIAYYQHKLNIENLLKKMNQFIIIRLPQVIGNSNNKNTILNFFIDAIKNDKKLFIKKEAYRYFIGIDDIAYFVGSLIQNNVTNLILDFANPYRYSVDNVLMILSKILNKNYINFESINAIDGYTINFALMNELIDRYQMNFDFSSDYLERKIKLLYRAKL